MNKDIRNNKMTEISGNKFFKALSLKHNFAFSLGNTLKFLLLLILVLILAGKDSFKVLAASQNTPEAIFSVSGLDPHGPNLRQTSGNIAAEEAEEYSISLLISAVIGLLLIASLVGIITTRLRLPYTVGLVLIGLALSLRGQENIEIPPEIFLGLLVPPLIFEAAFHINFKDLLKDLAPIIALAIPGVIITTLLVGGVVAWGTGFPIATALVFGALVAATDPVAVVALFRTLGVPKRLQVLLEGESLFNDGTAIVVFNLMIVIAVTGEFQLLDSLIDFVLVAGGGLVVGFTLGVIISQAIRFIDDSLIVTTLTTVLAFGSRILVFNFWDYAAFLANSVVFLLIGLQINLLVLLADWQVILWAILAVLVARAVSVYGLSWIGKGIPFRFKNVIFWGGLRGAISLALAISLPASLGPAREKIQAMAFGVVLFTLLVQSLTMKPLINKMDLIHKSEAQEEYERRHARSVMAKASYERLKEMHQSGLISGYIWDIMSTPSRQHAEALADAVSEALHADQGVEEEVFDTAMREMLVSQRSALNALLRNGIINEETFAQLVIEVDTALSDPQSNLLEIILNRHKNPINGLMMIVLQESDSENVMAILNRLGNPVTRLSSSGGFLGRKNITLLAGVSDGKVPAILKAITGASQHRVEFLPASTEETQESTSVFVSGATIFTFDIERFEEF